MQRVAIARALVHKPSLVLADEPTGNLDPDSAAAVMDLLRECLVAENATALLVTHSRAAARRADRALLMSASGLAPIDVSAAPGDAMRRVRAMTGALDLARATLGGALGRNRGRLALAVLAIALGVALGFAVATINRTAVDEFVGGMRTLAGSADFEIRGPRGGFDEMLFARIARDEGVAVASPVVEVDAQLVGRREALRIYGIDAFRASLVTPALLGSSDDTLDLLRPDTVFLSAGHGGVARRRPGRPHRGADGPAHRFARGGGSGQRGVGPAVCGDGHRGSRRICSAAVACCRASTCARARARTRVRCARALPRCCRRASPSRRRRRARPSPRACRGPIA